MNPTNAVLEERVAALENGRAGLAVASGHAAQLIALHTLMEPGDEIVAARQLYGGSINQFSQSLRQVRLACEMGRCDAIRKSSAPHSAPKTRAVFIESIANPGGIITDIEAIAAIAHSAGVPLIVDNTLASPYLIRPIEWGADIVRAFGDEVSRRPRQFHGRRDRGRRQVRLGQRQISDPQRALPSYHGMKMWETFGDMAFAIACRVLGLRDLGPALSPTNAFLVLTGIETLPLRMQRHCDNALAVAQVAEGRSAASPG